MKHLHRRSVASAAIVLLTIGVLAACAVRPSDPAPARADLTAEVTSMFARSAAAWNRGDLDGFMTDYLPGDRTTFVTSRGVIRGPAAIRARYAPRFAPGAMHDSLSFQAIEVDSLAPGVLNVIAEYVLTRGDSLIGRGPTSLVMVRRDGRLRIVHDHSS